MKYCFDILDRPRIHTFTSAVSDNNSIILTCRATGLPEPTYEMFLHDMKLYDVVNGVLIYPGNNLNYSATYSCIAKNVVGNDRQLLILGSLEGKQKYLVKSMLY